MPNLALTTTLQLRSCLGIKTIDEPEALFQHVGKFQKFLRNSSYRRWHNLWQRYQITMCFLLWSVFLVTMVLSVDRVAILSKTPVRLTTGCQTLLSVIWFPFFGLCDCSPAGGERSRLHSLLWLCLDVWMSLLTCQLQSSPAEFCLYIFGGILLWLKLISQAQFAETILKLEQGMEKTETKLTYQRNQICLNHWTFKTKPYLKQPEPDSL